MISLNFSAGDEQVREFADAIDPGALGADRLLIENRTLTPGENLSNTLYKPFIFVAERIHNGNGCGTAQDQTYTHDPVSNASRWRLALRLDYFHLRSLVVPAHVVCEIAMVKDAQAHGEYSF